MSIIDLKKAKAEREPHLSGGARCLACRHEWDAVAPVGAVWLECPACSLEQGRFIVGIVRDCEHWTCGCECDLFHVTDLGIYCPNCGEWQQGF